jgi:uncharacterized membrane protein YjjP (DUF1212 family)
MADLTNLPRDSGAGKSESWRTPDPRAAFILALGRALHNSGEPTPRIEDMLEEMADRLGVRAQFFITPTSIFAAFGPEDAQHTHLVRTSPSGTNLGKLTRVDRVAKQVLRRELTPPEGLARLDAIDHEPPVVHPWFRVLGFGLASGCAARFVGGGLREMAVAAGAGLALGVLSVLAARREALARLYEPMSAFLAAVLVSAGAFAFGGISYSRAVVASLIVLVPGMVLTTAMQELTVGHLTSGTTRLMSAVTTFLGIGFGFAFAAEIVRQVAGAPPLAAVDRLPQWTEWVALLVASASFGLLLKAEWRDLGWIVLAAAVGYFTSRLGGRFLGPELGTFAGAFAVGMGSNLYARVFDKPEAITEVPGILILVPGSIGFRGITAMLDNEVVSGVETGFRMLMIAVSLVAGLLIANLMMPKGRAAEGGRGRQGAG